MRCDLTCRKGKKWDIARICCAVEVLSRWSRNSTARESILRVIAVQIGPEHADAVRAEYGRRSEASRPR
jgi:hypothetical protein